ncbi:hypothetical protein M378DRAFT_15350 [Amanita muscaria Koide BX008]|uniref:Uncharacterized protein n=1 Tax=Amanita muscaria (strain Koide BX008) TaxID=946122 RepID=A0A0C2WR13_AMAMK|nr:hypothetical protein M378DRAFT_15350 [Amanita muscaria Koide BX008]
MALLLVRLSFLRRHKVRAFPDELDIHNVPPEYNREGTDWCAVFNPKVKRVLDVQLVHNLVHKSVVCCVRFSSDGKYLATGCNRTAQIYDTKTGAKTCVLTDETAGKAGDLYIRSVCFSPDGKLLATGAEDKQIRIASAFPLSPHILRRRPRFGTFPKNVLCASLTAINKKSTLLISLSTDA